MSKKPKKEWLFEKNEHVNMIKPIAIGLQRAQALHRYLELGIRKGPCFNAIAPLAYEAYAVDVNDCYKHISHNPNVKWFHCTTDEFFRKHDKNIKFDMVFIDACHTHEASLQDFKNVFSLVNENGIILLHDTYPYVEELTNSHLCSDTYKTAAYIKKYYIDRCEIVTLPFYFGITIVRRINRQLLWQIDKSI
jgi:hypothetical protein